MADEQNPDAVEFDESPSEEVQEINGQMDFGQAVIHATDWTTETIVNQLHRGNILLKPRFQRRDAWKIPHKSRFIESLILGLPIPQIVLAESSSQRGKFIVLDGKQRLLSLLQFWGMGEGRNNSYSLSGLQVLTQLNRKSYADLEQEPDLEEQLNSLLNQPIRTVVIKNWPSTEFLHLVFLRLNTGSVKLSPQELRQAIAPGPFTDWVDESAVNSEVLRQLLGLEEPDPRMRDIELLARSLAFAFFIESYRGRMKDFLDYAFARFNAEWDYFEARCATELRQIEEGVRSLTTLFGQDVARKPGGRLFNKAVFDFLIYYARNEDVRTVQAQHPEALRVAYRAMFESSDFVSAVERDTAGLPNTATRFRAWGAAVNEVGGLAVGLPELVGDPGQHRLVVQSS
jgi:hypothetical protein